jgi:Family of unknown function (DUF6093)
MTDTLKIVNDTAVTRYARRYAEANMTAQVKITRMDEAVLDESGGLTATEMHTVYEGKGRVYGVSGPMTMNLGEEPQYFSSTYVSIPYDATMPRVDDVIKVTEHYDETLVGRTFRVMDVEAGGQYPAVRRMQVTGVQNSKAWVQVVQAQQHPVRAIPKEWRV